MSEGIRRSGILLPLFSAVSSASWGCGDIGDIAPLASWLSGAGQRVLQLLPVNEMAPGNDSPYSALSAMAIDPIFVSLPRVPEFADAGGLDSLQSDDRHALTLAMESARVPFGLIRPIKHRALTAAFERFITLEWTANTARAESFRAFTAEQHWWLDDYALFRALHDREGGRIWTAWPDDVRYREPGALATARTQLARDVQFHQYVQWLAETQWTEARTSASAQGVALFGDVPFMVDLHSADVWSRQGDFFLDRSVGVPPDAFSETGQDWGMPVYNWDAVAAGDFQWLRARARRSARLFDGYRIDHLVGFYRTYSRRRDDRSDPMFAPADAAAQLELGERVLNVFRSAGAEVIAEDLGTIPDFVRASLALLGIPGFRVFRWERAWHEWGQPFRDPAEYPPVSVATSGTHDTESQASWWDSASGDDRQALLAVSTVRRLAAGQDLASAPFTDAVRDLLLEALFAAASRLVLFPMQDVFGWRERINVPATVNDDNWTYRLPWLVDALPDNPDAHERQQTLRRWAERHARWSPAEARS